jgi:paraquat-inducible protein B
VHLRRRDKLATSDAYILYRATSVPSVIWIALFVALVAGSWLVAWQPISAVLAAGA